MRHRNEPSAEAITGSSAGNSASEVILPSPSSSGAPSIECISLIDHDTEPENDEENAEPEASEQNPFNGEMGAGHVAIIDPGDLEM